MQLLWGSRFSFPENGVAIGSRTRLVTSDAGRPVRYVTRVSCSGWLEGLTQAALSAQEQSLRTALLVPYQDLKFLSDSGAVMAVSLLNSQTLSGVRVVDGPHFSGDTGAEYATLRKFEFEVEAEYQVPGTDNAVVSFTESVTITGDGGPVKRIRVPINTTTLVRQQISPASVVRATQSGTAVGLTKKPTPPLPIWPKFYLGDQKSIQERGPEPLGRGFVNYAVSWSYQFEADQPLLGSPNLFPV
jgi:hypothetical protein